ncbi:hypothetical protein [Myroides fluvii]|uniref:hypothetical protein n=1 Tax=Myroides fluvii TaxID=2572594 RepID=UPI00131DB299|nr:hypothetical protein [Myroides fluvii]
MKKTILLLLLSLGTWGCTDYIRNEDQPASPNRWKANFKIQDRVVPIIFELDTVPLNIYGYRVRFIDGPGKNQKEIVKIIGDSISVKLDYFGEVHLKGILKDQQITGVFQHQKSKPPLEIAFTAHPTSERRFTPVTKPSSNNPTGDWEFVFKADLTSPNLGLYQKLSQLQLYKTDSTLVANGYYSQGFEGILTENGFVLSSFSRDQPVLYEATFINPNEVKGTLYTPLEVISFRGRKKSNLESTAESSSNIVVTLWNLLKAYIEYPK